MDVQPDFRELLALLNKREAEYLIVEGHALDDFGFGSLGLTEEDFTSPHRVVQLGVPPVRVDLLTSLTGVTWDQAAASKCPGTYGDVPVFFIGRREFIANKRATGRKRDLADIEALGGE